MGKYKKTVKAELKWLHDDINLIDKILKSEKDRLNDVAIEIFETRKLYAQAEINRLDSWLHKFKHKGD